MFDKNTDMSFSDGLVIQVCAKSKDLSPEHNIGFMDGYR